MKKASRKKPLLVAPWKIGLLVALLLIVVGAGVGSYLVKMYGVELKWMPDSSQPWRIDSYQFFKEMYPLVASVVILSLISYFAIAAAVRRYKSFLDSGQDYRTMISLAKSIDDLTNPAQISKLSAYPELQSVLRSYGDSIREISSELERKEKEFNTEKIEGQIESLFKGETLKEDAIDAKWELILNKAGSCFDANRREITELRDKTDIARQTLSQAVLSLGKLLETAMTMNEDLHGIVEAVGELNEIATRAAGGSGRPSKDAPAAKGDVPRAIVDEMVNTLNKLEDGGRVLNEFATENNGLALNMALKAAKGGIVEQDLAHYAEKIRAAAERFNKLSGMVSSIAQGLLGNCYKLSETMGGAAVMDAAIDPGAANAMSGISEGIEERSKRLDRSFSGFQSEIDDVHSALQNAVSAIAGAPVQATEKPKAVKDENAPQAEELGVVNFGGFSGGEADSASDMVIQHGSTWETSFGTGQQGSQGGGDGETAMADSEMLDEIDVNVGDDAFIAESKGARGGVQAAGIADDAYDRSSTSLDDTSAGEYTIDIEDPQAAVKPSQERRGEAPPGEAKVGWADLQQNRAVRVEAPGTAEGAAPPPAAERAPAVKQEAQGRGSEDTAAAKRRGPFDEGRPVPGAPPGGSRSPSEDIDIPDHEWVKVDVEGSAADFHPEQVDAGTAGQRSEDEPIYDLFELGAIEYVEETK